MKVFEHRELCAAVQATRMKGSNIGSCAQAKVFEHRELRAAAQASRMKGSNIGSCAQQRR